MATPTTSDGELLIRTVYDRYARALHGYVTSLLDGDRPGADDVVQETALRAWRHADRLDATGAALRPWLFKVAKRIVIDRYRQRQARPEVAGALPDRPAISAIVGNRSTERATLSMRVPGFTPGPRTTSGTRRVDSYKK